MKMNFSGKMKWHPVMRMIGCGIISICFFSVCSGKVPANSAKVPTDTITTPPVNISLADSLGLNPESRYNHLTEADFELVA